MSDPDEASRPSAGEAAPLLPPARYASLPPRLVPILAGLVLVLAAFVRLWAVRDQPRWYNDELFNLKIIQDLLHGQLKVRAVTWTGFSPFHPYPLGYHLVGAVFCGILGSDVWTVRLMCGLLGVATTWFVFLCGREIFDERAGLIAAVLYAVHPKIVLFTRWAFPQNLSPLVVTACLYAGLRFYRERSRGWLMTYALLSGLSLVSIYWAGTLFLLMLVLVLKQAPKKTPLAFAIALTPISLQFLAVSAVHGFGPVLYDLKYLFGIRILAGDDPSGSFTALFLKTIRGYLDLFVKGPCFLLGVIGLFWLPRRDQSNFLLGALALLSLAPVMQRGPLLASFFYNAVFFAPIPLIGFGALFARLLYLGANIRDLLRRNLIRFAGNVALLGALGFGWYVSARQTFIQTPAGLRTALDIAGFTLENHHRTEETAEYINRHTQASDFVIATPNLPWLLHCHATDVQQMASRLPGSTIWYPPKLPDSRYVYDIDHRKARFLVMDRLTVGFYITVRNCDEVLYRVDRERWPLVQQIGEFTIFANPRFLENAAKSAVPVLPAELQWRLAILHEDRHHTGAAVRWYLRAFEKGGASILRKMKALARSEPGRIALRQALAQLSKPQATPE